MGSSLIWNYVIHEIPYLGIGIKIDAASIGIPASVPD
jgi:hypothetical protein